MSNATSTNETGINSNSDDVINDNYINLSNNMFRKKFRNYNRDYYNRGSGINLENANSNNSSSCNSSTHNDHIDRAKESHSDDKSQNHEENNVREDVDESGSSSAAVVTSTSPLPSTSSGLESSSGSVRISKSLHVSLRSKGVYRGVELFF